MKKYYYRSIAVQRNSLVGFLCKIFINSVLIEWRTILFEMIDKHEIWLDPEQ